MKILLPLFPVPCSEVPYFQISPVTNYDFSPSTFILNPMYDLPKNNPLDKINLCPG